MYKRFFLVFGRKPLSFSPRSFFLISFLKNEFALVSWIDNVGILNRRIYTRRFWDFKLPNLKINVQNISLSFSTQTASFNSTNFYRDFAFEDGFEDAYVCLRWRMMTFIFCLRHSTITLGLLLFRYSFIFFLWPSYILNILNQKI